MHPLLQRAQRLFEEKSPVSQARQASQASQASQARAAPDLVAPASYRHPQATRETMLGHTLVAFQFKSSQRRTIGFSIKKEGLVVSAPAWVTRQAVEAALQEKARWIIQKLGEVQARHQSLVSQDIAWLDGTQLPYLGAPLTVRLTPPALGQRAISTLWPGTPEAPEAPEATEAPRPLTLQLALSLDASPAQIRQATLRWLLAQAQSHFSQRLDHYAPQLQVNWRSLTLSNAATRWGSARSDGSIRLNWRLMHLAPAVIDYVVAHELSHLREMNHSPRFWATVRSVMPDYAERREQLKDHPVPRWQ